MGKIVTLQNSMQQVKAPAAAPAGGGDGIVIIATPAPAKREKLFAAN